MNLFIVSDIFGRTPALDAICENINNIHTSHAIRIIDPYNGVQHKFKTQDIAYKYFISNVGLEEYASILRKRLANVQQNTILIGFSVGASVIWEISGQKPRNILKAFCFYGSQIRNKKDISPMFDVELIFPKSEPGFDVNALGYLLEKKKHVTCKKAKGLHGFMNEVSSNFDQRYYTEFIEYLKISLGT
jgi:dienelactone hydrolase